VTQINFRGRNHQGEKGKRRHCIVSRPCPHRGRAKRRHREPGCRQTADRSVAIATAIRHGDVDYYLYMPDSAKQLTNLQAPLLPKREHQGNASGNCHPRFSETEARVGQVAGRGRAPLSCRGWVLMGFHRVLRPSVAH
jgi:hypothetical protein